MGTPITPVEKFTRWYVEPFEAIKTVEGGGGAFVAMSIGLFLCERYFRSVTDTQDDSRREATAIFRNRAAFVLGVNPLFFKRFWNVVRNGIQHQGMIKTTPLGDRLYSWRLDGRYPALPAQLVVNGVCCICINPWGWTQKMIDLWLADPARLEEQTTHRFGGIFETDAGEPILYPYGSEYP
jgi:hypothetical protein